MAIIGSSGGYITPTATHIYFDSTPIGVNREVWIDNHGNLFVIVDRDVAFSLVKIQYLNGNIGSYTRSYFEDHCDKFGTVGDILSGVAKKVKSKYEKD